MKTLRLATAVLFGLAACTSVTADVVYEQLPDLSLGGYFSDGVPGQFYSQRVADDFSLGAATTITGVSFWGGSEFFIFPDLSNFSDFVVEVFADNAGAVGASVYSETFTTANTNPVFDGFGIAGQDIYYHTVNFSAPVAVGAGGYWLSVGSINISPGDDAYAWNIAAAVANDQIAADFFDGNGFQVFTGTGDVAFQIHAVPEPGTASLVGLAVAGLFVRRRRA